MYHRNGAIVLNELGLEYNLAPVDIPGGEHKGPEFTKLNPNGRIPALVDHTNGDFVIWYAHFVSRMMNACYIESRSDVIGSLAR